MHSNLTQISSVVHTGRERTLSLLTAGYIDHSIVRERRTVEGEDEPEVREVRSDSRPALEDATVVPPILDVAVQSVEVGDVAQQLATNVALPGDTHVLLPERGVLGGDTGVARIVEHDDCPVGASVGDRLRDLEPERATVRRQTGRDTDVRRRVGSVVAVRRIRHVTGGLGHRDRSLARSRDAGLTAEAVTVRIAVPGGTGRAHVRRRVDRVVAVTRVGHVARRLRDRHHGETGRHRRTTAEAVTVRIAVPGGGHGADELPARIVVVTVARDEHVAGATDAGGEHHALGTTHVVTVDVAEARDRSHARREGNTDDRLAVAEELATARGATLRGAGVADLVEAGVVLARSRRAAFADLARLHGTDAGGAGLIAHEVRRPVITRGIAVVRIQDLSWHARPRHVVSGEMRRTAHEDEGEEHEDGTEHVAVHEYLLWATPTFLADVRVDCKGREPITL